MEPHRLERFWLVEIVNDSKTTKRRQNEGKTGMCNQHLVKRVSIVHAHQPYYAVPDSFVNKLPSPPSSAGCVRRRIQMKKSLTYLRFKIFYRFGLETLK